VTETKKIPFTVWIDNDGCPAMVRELVFGAGQRFGLRVVVVANSYMRIPLNPLFSMVCVRGDFDAADNHIADHVQSGDLVITGDVPLAARIVAKGALGLSTRGDIFDESCIAERLAIRNLMQELRSGGEVRGGPPPLNAGDKKRFADALDRLLAQLRR
jgi:uncharacterized protein YaiI (UPF0178 family)